MSDSCDACDACDGQGVRDIPLARGGGIVVGHRCVICCGSGFGPESPPSLLKPLAKWGFRVVRSVVVVIVFVCLLREIARLGIRGSKFPPAKPDAKQPAGWVKPSIAPAPRNEAGRAEAVEGSVETVESILTKIESRQASLQQETGGGSREEWDQLREQKIRLARRVDQLIGTLMEPLPTSDGGGVEEVRRCAALIQRLDVIRQKLK